MRRILFIFIIMFLNISYIFADVEIYSVMPNTEDDKNLEYIEIINNTDNTINISGYKLEDKSGATYIIGEIILEPKNNHKFYYNITNIRLNNSNEIINLYNKNNELIDTVEYTSSKKGEEIIISELENKITIKQNFEENNLDKNLENSESFYKKGESKIIFNLLFSIILFIIFYFMFFINKKPTEKSH